jgi:hypothetical protein
MWSKTIRPILFLVFICGALPASAQSTAVFYNFNSTKSSLEDIKTGKIITSEFDAILPLRDGRYLATQNNKKGLLSQNGELALPCEYEELYLLKGYYLFQKKYKRGLLDSSLNEIIPPKYNRIMVYDNYIAAVKKDSLGAFDLKGKLLIPFEYQASGMTEPSFFRFNKNKKAGVIDSLNNIVIPFEYSWISKFTTRSADFEYLEDNQFNKNDLYCVIDENSLTGINAGVFNSKGEMLIPVKYQNVFNIYSNGLIGVTLDKKAGFINLKNEIVIPLMYDEALSFTDGVSCVKLNHKYGAINAKNEIVIPITYPEYLIFKNGIAKFTAYIDNKTKFGFISNKGKILIPAQYDEVDYLSTGYFRVRKDKNYGIVSTAGKEIIPTIYNGGIIIYDTKIFNGEVKDKDKFILVKDKKYGVVDENNKTLIPCEYNYVSMSGNIIMVNKDNLYGCYNDKFESIIPPTYLNMRHNRDSGRISVLDKDGNCYNIDLKGNRTTVFE